MSRKTNRRTFLKIAGLTGVGAVLAACGQTAATSAPAATAASQATTAPAAAPTTAPAAGTATLEFWTFNDYATGVPLQLFQGFISDFQTANPSIKVNITGKPGSDILTGIVSGAGSGDLPDAMQVQEQVGGNMIAVNALQDMEPYWATMTDDYRGQFNKAALNPCIQDGKLYGLPFSAAAWLLFRNLTVLKKASIDTSVPPKDWADFADQLDKVTKAGFKGMGKILGQYETLFYSVPGGIAGPDRQTIAPDTKSTLLQASAYQAVWEYLLKIKPYTVGSFTADQATVDLFSTNQLGFLVQGCWEGPTLDAVKGKNGFDYDVIEIPGQTADSKGTMRGGEFTGMTSLKQKDQTWKFIQFISDYPQEGKWAVTIGRLMANDKVLQLPDAMKNPLLQVTGKAYNNGITDGIPMKKFAANYAQPEIDFGTQVDTGKMTPADAAPQMIAAINKILAAG